MSRTISLVQRVQIASPCPAKWDDMVGDDRSRFCSLCKLNVYNLAAMTEAEGEALIIEKEGKLCARIYRRYDGTILTKDCPVGLRALRRRAAWVGLRAVAAVVCLISSAAYAVNTGRPKVKMTPQIERIIADVNQRQPSAYAKAASAVHRWFAAVPPAPRFNTGFSGGVLMPSSTFTQRFQQPQSTGSSTPTPAHGSTP